MQTADQSFFEKEYIFEKKPEIEDIPKQIRELLTTQGGRLKRIIILGISAEDIILYGNISINKIRNYLAFIEKCTDVVVVGFAPSDIEVPIKKTAPYFMEDYEGLISEIETMENVVFDAEPDINEVGAFLAICDEYVGGENSISRWCKKNGIPITVWDYSSAAVLFDESFFKEEARNGFYISEMMKRFWAAQIVVYKEIEKICKKHSLTFHVDMGTLLGTVRHKGYIPWDDDFDISMLRDEWEIFFEVAKDELPEDYLVLNAENNEEYSVSLGRVVNSKAIDFGEEHMKRFCGCPYVVGVDIFPIDRIFNDEKKENDRKDRAKDVYRAADLIGEKGIEDPEVKRILSKIESENHTVIHKDQRIGRELVLLNERISKECRDKDAKEAAFMNPWVMNSRMNCKVELFKQVVQAPFENITVPIPKGYDEILTKEYGQYTKIFKGGGIHEYPVYRGQEDILKKHLGHNPYRYTLTRDEYEKALAQDRKKENKSRDEYVIYRPLFEIDDPIDEKDKIIVALKPYIERPEVVFADVVLVKSETMRKLYIDTLTSITGEESRKFWSQKIQTEK